MDGCPIEDLGLDFTLPGYPNIELRKGGNSTATLITRSSTIKNYKATYKKNLGLAETYDIVDLNLKC